MFKKFEEERRAAANEAEKETEEEWEVKLKDIIAMFESKKLDQDEFERVCGWLSETFWDNKSKLYQICHWSKSRAWFAPLTLILFYWSIIPLKLRLYHPRMPCIVSDWLMHTWHHMWLEKREIFLFFLNLKYGAYLCGHWWCHSLTWCRCRSKMRPRSEFKAISWPKLVWFSRFHSL